MESNLPWRVFQNPIEQWSALPSFMIGELLFIALAVALLVHAMKRGRAHLLVWVGALLAGTVNDLIFMALPLVDNFWHGQATVMLTARLPLYIPCVYVSFMYLPTVAVHRLRLPLLASAALTGLVAINFYIPFDITGAKLLWWTWHDTDLPIAARILGAPASSTLWVLTFAGTFALLVGWIVRRYPEMTWASFFKGLALVAALSTVLMMVQITVLQQLDGGAPGYLALGTGVGLYLALTVWGARRGDPEAPSPLDRIPHVAAIVYFVTLAVVMVAFDPTTHRSTGVHQVVGECYVEAADITGLTRYQYLCLDDYDEDFTFDCVDEPPADDAAWYTICGRAHQRYGAHVAGVAGVGGLGTAVFTLLFVFFGRRREDSASDR